MSGPGPVHPGALDERPRLTGEAARPGGRLQVFHDGACPLCRREMAFFRRRVPEAAVEFVDVSTWPPGTRRHGLDAETAMARFHVREPDGTMHSGARAFAALWRVTPGLRVVGRIAALLPVAALLEGAYRLFLRLRPRLQRLAGGGRCTGSRRPDALRDDAAG